MIDVLEVVVRNWYLHSGYCNNDRNWFRILTNFSYANKILCVVDETGLTQSREYVFQSNNTEEVVQKAIEHFKMQMVLTNNDIEEVSKILDNALGE